jgi:hypothetical protein
MKRIIKFVIGILVRVNSLFNKKVMSFSNETHRILIEQSLILTYKKYEDRYTTITKNIDVVSIDDETIQIRFCLRHGGLSHIELKCNNGIISYNKDWFTEVDGISRKSYTNSILDIFSILQINEANIEKLHDMN